MARGFLQFERSLGFSATIPDYSGEWRAFEFMKKDSLPQRISALHAAAERGNFLFAMAMRFRKAGNRILIEFSVKSWMA